MQFSDIPGLNELKLQLIAAQQKGKIPHAQLYSGSPGTASLAITQAYTSYLFCQNPTETDSCGKCPNCLRIKKHIHPDVHYIFPKISAQESKYEKIHGEAITSFRKFLSEQPFGSYQDWITHYGQENKNLLISKEDSKQLIKNVSMRSVEGGYKVFIIWCPESMNASSSNAILKILEEPPEKTIYLLVTYSYESLLATITSRSQLITVPLHTDEEIYEYLIQNGIEATKAEHYTQLADGKIGVATTISNEVDHHEFQEFQLWMRQCLGKKVADLVIKSEAFSKSGRANQLNELDYQLSLIRKALTYLGGGVPKMESDEEKTFISNFANKLGMEKLEKTYQLINRVANNIERNANAKIAHLNLSLDIMQIIK